MFSQNMFLLFYRYMLQDLSISTPKLILYKPLNSLGVFACLQCIPYKPFICQF